MTDLEIVRACAEAMCWTFFRSKHGHWSLTDPDGGSHHCCDWAKFDQSTGEKLAEPTEADALMECGYDPLHDDAQAMALVKRFRLDVIATLDIQSRIRGNDPHDGWSVEHPLYGNLVRSRDIDLNRAICLCASRLAKGR